MPVPVSSYDSIVSLFEKQAASKPEAVALVYAEERWTYQELNDRSNQLANMLIERYGVMKGDRIAFSFAQRPVAILSTILAILKLGGVYIPIDPNNPRKRIAYLIEQAKPKLLITDPEAQSMFAGLGLEILDYTLHEPYSGYVAAPNISLEPNDPAYIIFTSGSTGMPKGVQVSHKSLYYAYAAWREIYQLDTIDVHLQVVGYAFDVFSGDWIRCLCSGAKLVMCPEDSSTKPQELYELIQKEGVECAEFLPVSLRKLMAYCTRNTLKLDTFKVLICGSDKWFIKEYFSFKRKLTGNARLINSYGTSETTIDTTYFEFIDDNMLLIDIVDQVPIGKAFPYMNIHVVNEDQQICETGVIGELYISGSGVSQGYINATQLNDEKFLTSCSFAEGPVYRTGDYGRILPTGDIEFLGRHDRQVKHKGKRIDLTEIERHLLDTDVIADCAVIVSEPESSNQLVSFVTLGADVSDIDDVKLRELALQRLPKYMVPDQFRILKDLPTNVNGKLDRRALHEY